MTRETLEMLEYSVQDSLNEMKGCEIGTKERNIATKEATELIDRLIACEHEFTEATDRQERREIDREKNETMVRIEEAKNDMPKWRMAIEIGKVVVPVVVNVTGVIAYSIFQKRLLKFEETGRICSTSGRELHLPKFLK